jgi:hypothetical protein
MEYLCKFDGGELFRMNILTRLEKLDVDVPFFLSLRTVSKVWKNLFYSMSRICFKASLCPSRNDGAIYDHLLDWFPATSRLIFIGNCEVQPNIPVPFFQHPLFSQLKKLSLTVPSSSLTSLLAFLSSLTQLTSLTLASSYNPPRHGRVQSPPLSDRLLESLPNLHSLKLTGPWFPDVTGSCFRNLKKLKKFSLINMPSVTAEDCDAVFFLALSRFSCNSLDFLGSIGFNGTCNLMDIDGKSLMYSGSFVNGEMHGNGVYYYPSGGRYVGEFENGEPSGRGSFYFDFGGEVYTGAWRNGLREGKGIQTYGGDRGHYDGDWLEGACDGYGVEEYPEGRYEGEWRNGNREGLGISYQLRRGRLELMYYGQYKDNVRDGYGVYYWENETRYEGEWKNDMRDGDGSTCYGLNRNDAVWEKDILVVLPSRFCTSIYMFIFVLAAFVIIHIINYYELFRWT